MNNWGLEGGDIGRTNAGNKQLHGESGLLLTGTSGQSTLGSRDAGARPQLPVFVPAHETWKSNMKVAPSLQRRTPGRCPLQTLRDIQVSLPRPVSPNRSSSQFRHHPSVLVIQVIPAVNFGPAKSSSPKQPAIGCLHPAPNPHEKRSWRCKKRIAKHRPSS